ncbi:MAG: uracil-DNA glycosylase [Pseudomonadota bacterium]
MKPAGIHAYLDEMVTTFRFMAAAGCRGFDLSPDKIDILSGWGKGPPRSPEKTLADPHISPGETLADIQKDLGACRRCGLYATRQNIVFGDGNPRARLVFVGEGPGGDEDRQGKPFVGAAGQLLTRIIEAMGLTRDEVYICNVVKCRPPGNRNPLPEEIRACAPFLARQIQAIGPEYICALGKFAARFLSGSEAPISALRGRVLDYHGIRVMPTYHPAYLLRSPEKKRDVWEDMKKIMQGLGLPVPGPKG